MTSDAGNKLNSSSIDVAAVDVVASDFADITVAAGSSFALCSPDCALAQKIAVHIPPQIIKATFSNLYIKPPLKFYVNRGFSYSQPITISGSTFVAPRVGTQQGASATSVS